MRWWLRILGLGCRMISEVSPKRAGFCSQCDTEIVTVKQEWTTEDKQGEPRVFGEINPGTKRTTMVLLSGANMDWSFCGRCELTPQAIPKIWRRMLTAAVVEISPERRKVHKMEPYTQLQQERAIETVIGYFVNPPIGILGTRSAVETT